MAKSGDKQQQQQTQNSQTTPWEPAQPMLMDLLSKYSAMPTTPTGAQTGATGQMMAQAGALPNFGAQGTKAINDLFSSSTQPQIGMLNDAYSGLKGNLWGTASGAELDPYSTPGFSTALDKLSGDITTRVKGVYAGAGRDPSGAGSFSGALGEGLAGGLAPMLAQQYNANKNNQMNAAGTIYNAGNTTAGGITSQQQVQLQNAASALGLSPQVLAAYMAPSQAQFAAAGASEGLPWANLARALQPAGMIAGLGGQSTGSGNTTRTQEQSTMSNVIGGTSAALGMLSLFSDERVKDEVEPIGMLNDGQKVVRFRYKGDGPMRIGVLAQDVAKFEPSAVGSVDGILTVDHRKATERAAAIGRRAA